MKMIFAMLHSEDVDETVEAVSYTHLSDLLIHLSAEQMEKKASKVIEGEALDLIFGSRPLAGEEKEAVKAGVMKLLAEQYGIEEEDFLSAELEVVPAGKAREAGLDRSMVLGYGQDDLSLIHI